LSLGLLVFEDAHWRGLRPLTDLVPVPALAFGASSLAERLARAAGLPLMAIAARPDTLVTCRTLPRFVSATGNAHALVVNGAAMPGPWLESLVRDDRPHLATSGSRIAGARIASAQLEAGRSQGASFEALLRGLGLPECSVETRWIEHPWHLVEHNMNAIASDLADQPAERLGELHPSAVLLEPQRIRIESGARIGPLAVLDARGGPILVRENAMIAPHTLVEGPCVIGRGSQLFGGLVGHCTIGPECRLAGEIGETIWQGYANKRHHGFVGNSVIGEWANLGAMSTTSNLKNNYGNVRVWVDGREIETGSPRVGSFIGAHAKTGIGSLLPTGCSVGTGANLFGGGRFAPKSVPSFAWWDGERMIEHRCDPFLATARVAMSRRGQPMTAEDEQALRRLFEATRSERST